MVGTNPDSLIEFKFWQESFDSDIIGLKAYMNNLITKHDVIQQFHLKKVEKYWGYADEKFFYFILSPEWIKFDLSSNKLSPAKKLVSTNNVTQRLKGPSHMDITKTSNTIDESDSAENSGLFQY